MENQEDILLLSRIKNGDVPAYEQLYKKYYKLLNTEAFLLLEDAMEAEDEVQCLFVEIWHRQLYLNINSSVKAYLQKSIHNRCLKVIRKRKTMNRQLDEYASSLEGTVAGEDGSKQEEAINMTALLRELPLQRSEAFNLVYMENKKYKEAAAEMGISINSVKTHLKLAVKMLRKRFLL